MHRVAAVLVLPFLLSCRPADPRAPDGARLVRLGYMPNVTHAPALWGLESGAFEKALGEGAALQARAFNAGPAVVEALFAGEIDVAYIGPNPTVNGYQKSRGKALRIVAGATANGAQLVVRPSIASARDLAGKRIASPALGNTQDVALRTWLARQGISAEVLPIANPDALTLFARGEIAGAWLPEPWSSRLVVENQGKVLVDERELWPGGRFPTALLVASTPAIERRADLVRRVVEANEVAVQALVRADARELVLRRLARELGKPLPPGVGERAFQGLSFSSDPLETELRKTAEDAQRLGFLRSADVAGIVDPRFLPSAVRAAKEVR